MRSFRIAACVACLACLALPAAAGIRGPGKYCGVVVFDRWGGCALHSGAYVTYVSEAVKEKLRGHAGESVQIDATRVSQASNPGDGLIHEFKYLGPAPVANGAWYPAALALTAEADFKDGEKPAVLVVLKNTGPDTLKVGFSQQLAPTLFARRVHKTPFDASDSPSYAMITRVAFVTCERGDRAGGKGVASRDWYALHVDGALPASVELKSGGVERARVTFNLPPGEYDFVAGYGSGGNEGRSLASDLVAFDVDAEGNATHAEVVRK